jgi:hypothetical protein
MQAQNLTYNGNAARKLPVLDILLISSAVAYIALLYFRQLAELWLGSWNAVEFANIASIFLTVSAVVWKCKTNAVRKEELAFACCALLVFSISYVFNASELSEVSILSETVRILRPIILCLVFTRIAEERRLGIRLLQAASAIAFLNLAVAIWGGFTHQNVTTIIDSNTMFDPGIGSFGFDASTGRSGGIRGENYAAYWVAPLLGLGISLITYRKRPALGWALVTYSLVGIFVSMSRSAFVSSIGAIALGIWIGTNRLFRVKARRWSGTAWLFVVVASIFVIGSLIVWFYVGSLEGRTADLQAARWLQGWTEDARTEIYRLYLGIGLEAPVTGSGPGFIQMQVEDFSQTVPHNSLLDIFVEYGMAGLLLYLVPAWRLRHAFMRTMRGEGDYYQANCILALTIMVISLMFLSDPFGPMLWVVVGIATGITRPTRPEGGNLAVPGTGVRQAYRFA